MRRKPAPGDARRPPQVYGRGMREIRLNAFEMNCVGHQSPGLWAHPRDRSANYTDLEYWTGLARTLERGKFDGIFLADVLGLSEAYGGSPLARRMSTVDHLTKGRAGWNIVTGYLNSAAAGMGLKVQPRHEERYAIAEEYMQVVYQLWEGSWENGSVLRDRERRIFADAARIHRVRQDGHYYRLDAIHLSEPSPQRTPVLYQAGASTSGRAFAAAHPECVFIKGPTGQVVAPQVADIRRRAAALGRDPHDLLIFTLTTVITGRDEAEAKAKHAEYRRYVDYEAALDRK